jgi:hypothetical protein
VVVGRAECGEEQREHQDGGRPAFPAREKGRGRSRDEPQTERADDEEGNIGEHVERVRQIPESSGIGEVVIAPPLVDRGERERDSDGRETQASEDEDSGIGAGRDHVGALLPYGSAFRDLHFTFAVSALSNLDRGTPVVGLVSASWALLSGCTVRDRTTRRPACQITGEFLDFGLI